MILRDIKGDEKRQYGEEVEKKFHAARIAGIEGIIAKNLPGLYMAQYYRIHPDNPQPRLIGQTAAALRRGGVISYPTDSCYALCCLIGNRPGPDRIAQIRRLEPGHLMTLVCRDLSEVGMTALIDNALDLTDWKR